MDYTFRKIAGHMLESRQTQVLVLHGNIHGLFYMTSGQTLDDKAHGSYVTLIDYLKVKWDVRNTILVVMGQNGILNIDPAQK
jgi:hypothetical protein